MCAVITFINRHVRANNCINWIIVQKQNRDVTTLIIIMAKFILNNSHFFPKLSGFFAWKCKFFKWYISLINIYRHQRGTILFHDGTWLGWWKWDDIYDQKFRTLWPKYIRTQYRLLRKSFHSGLQPKYSQPLFKACFSSFNPSKKTNLRPRSGHVHCKFGM